MAQMEKIDTRAGVKTPFDDLSLGTLRRPGFRFPHARGATGKFRLFGHYVHAQFLLLAISELVVIFFIGIAIYNYFIATSSVNIAYSTLGMGFKIASMSTVFVLFMVAVGLYDTRQRERVSGLVMRLVIALLLGAVSMMALLNFVPSLWVGEGFVETSAIVSVVALAAIRALFYKFVDGRVLLKRILVVGTGKNALFIERLRRKADKRGFHLVGFVSLDANESIEVDRSRILTLDDKLCTFAAANDIDEIVLALDDRRQNLPTDELLNCRMSGVGIIDSLEFFERERALIQLDFVQPSWFLQAEGFKKNFVRASVKRIFDILVSAVLLIATLPITMLTAIAIFLDGGGKGSVFYSQQRVGLNGRCFNVHKFRSMKTCAEADGVARWAQKNDPRVTRVGTFIRKYRLDELPQLWNVLVGEMSLVGPRPERPEFVYDLSEASPFYKERHRVCPGMTGWAQLCYPYGASEEDSMAKLQYDLYYAKNHGLFLDVYTLIQTIEVVLFKKGSR